MCCSDALPRGAWLTARQPYSVDVKIRMPESEQNLNLGTTHRCAAYQLRRLCVCNLGLTGAGDCCDSGVVMLKTELLCKTELSPDEVTRPATSASSSQPHLITGKYTDLT